jgi:hypothetical protein
MQPRSFALSVLGAAALGLRQRKPTYSRKVIGWGVWAGGTK